MVNILHALQAWYGKQNSKIVSKIFHPLYCMHNHMDCKSDGFYSCD